tara:strand:+ start:87 stop:500 length:414 start_codon:yes stop_codon:yes gene_type:complete
MFGHNYRKDIINTFNQEETPITKTFFSNTNIELIQTMIYNNIKHIYKYKIDKQPVENLLMVMRSMYVLYGNPKNSDIKQEIVKLNELVINKCTEIIISNILMYFKYVEDASTLPTPIDRGKFESSKGDTNLEFTNFF